MKNEIRVLEQQLEVATEFCRQYQIENAQLKAKLNHLQFLLDSVMLEVCSDEMTEEQMENWKKHQQRVEILEIEA